MMGTWPDDPDGNMVPVLRASLEAVKRRHPAGKGRIMTEQCDRCDKSAVYRLTKPFGTGLPVPRQINRPTLTLCKYHGDMNMASLKARGWTAEPEGVSP